MDTIVYGRIARVLSVVLGLCGVGLLVAGVVAGERMVRIEGMMMLVMSSQAFLGAESSSVARRQP